MVTLLEKILGLEGDEEETKKISTTVIVLIILMVANQDMK